MVVRDYGKIFDELVSTEQERKIAVCEYHIETNRRGSSSTPDQPFEELSLGCGVIQDRLLRARAHAVLGDRSTSLQNYPEARMHYEQALELRENAPHSIVDARLFASLGRIHRLEKNPEAARVCFTESLEQLKELQLEHLPLTLEVTLQLSLVEDNEARRQQYQQRAHEWLLGHPPILPQLDIGDVIERLQHDEKILKGEAPDLLDGIVATPNDRIALWATLHSNREVAEAEISKSSREIRMLAERDPAALADRLTEILPEREKLVGSTDEDHLKVLQLYAVVLVQAGKTEDAIQAYQRIIKLRGVCGEISSRILKTVESSLEFAFKDSRMQPQVALPRSSDEALARIDHIGETLGLSNDWRGRVRALAAGFLMEQGLASEAFKAWKVAVTDKECPLQPVAYTSFAMRCLLEGCPEAAVAVAKTAAKLLIDSRGETSSSYLKALSVRYIGLMALGNETAATEERIRLWEAVDSGLPRPSHLVLTHKHFATCALLRRDGKPLGSKPIGQEDRSFNDTESDQPTDTGDLRPHHRFFTALNTSIEERIRRTVTAVRSQSLPFEFAFRE